MVGILKSKPRRFLVRYFLGGMLLLATTLLVTSLYLLGGPGVVVVNKLESLPSLTLPTQRDFQNMKAIDNNDMKNYNNNNINNNIESSSSFMVHEAQFIYANTTYTYRYSSKVFSKLQTRQQQQQQHKDDYTMNNSNNKNDSTIRLVFGVCANSQKPVRRQAIRKSWSQDSNAALTVFIVAGPYTTIQNEFEKHGDLLWVNVSESYRNGLTPKTLAFVHFGGTQLQVLKNNGDSNGNNDNADYSFDYIFKTDDDVYVNATHIGMELAKTVSAAQYYGMYKSGFAPIRDKSDQRLAKWYMSREEYPDDFFPPYAPGVGYALSRDFAACAAHHTQDIVHKMPWEDVAVGMLASDKICHVPLTGSDTNWPHFSLEPNSNSALDFFPYEEYKNGGRLVTILHKVQPWYFVPLYKQESLVEAKNRVMEKKKEVRTRRQEGGGAG